MAHKDPPLNQTAAKDDPAAAAERRQAQARMEGGLDMLRTLGQVALAGASLGGKAVLVGLRGTIPLLELYSGTTRRAEQSNESDGQGLEKMGFSRGEAGVLRKAFTKGVLESLEISSITHPVYDGAPVYRAYNADGVMQPPHMVHFLALAAAAAAIWRRWEAEQNPPPPEPPVVAIPASQTVAFVATAPGEYAYIAAPQTASDIRRYAMRQRSLNPPRLAMLASSRDPGSIVPAETRMLSASYPSSASPALSKTSPQAALQTRSAPLPQQRGCGCGCGCGGAAPCTCGCHETRHFPPARYDDDGRCVSILTISCETRWRIRDCLKTSFCDFLRCLGDELCNREKGQDIELRDCLEGFLCSFLACLPEAICPPEPCDPCCPPRPIESCHCNFAVGE